MLQPLRRNNAMAMLFFWTVTLLGLPAAPPPLPADAFVTVLSPAVSDVKGGRRIVQDVVLGTSAAEYTLRYDIVEEADDPARIGFAMWAPTIGYTPLGIVKPSLAGWYFQGFFVWTLDGFNIKDTRAGFRVVRGHGRDAMVAYTWNTPKAVVQASFAMTTGSDKLLFFGRCEPREEIHEIKLRLMAYPATFEKPWVRRLTTAKRTLSEGSAAIDLASERWLLLENVQPGRTGSGPVGLLLGDAGAFSSVTVRGIGGYAEYVDIVLAPGRRDFALGLYELAELPGTRETREYFRRSADAESDALARLARVHLDKPLAPLPVDARRAARIAANDEASLARPAETWRVPHAPLDFPWAVRLRDGPVRTALLAARWAAYDTMELGRRLQMDVRHQYFDTKSVLSSAGNWPYRNQTGTGPLKASVAHRHAMRICRDGSREVILVGAVNASALGDRLRAAILGAVRGGKGLVLTGGAGALAGWPDELTARPDEALARRVVRPFPGNLPRFQTFRYGKGRVLVFEGEVGRYLSLLPASPAPCKLGAAGLEAAEDLLLALHARALLLAAGRELPASISFEVPARSAPAAEAWKLPVRIDGASPARILVRVENEFGETIALGGDLLERDGGYISVPPLPAGPARVDVLLLDGDGACLGFGAAAVRVAARAAIDSLEISPARRSHEPAPPAVSLPAGGRLTCRAAVSFPAGTPGLSIAWEVRDSAGRLLAAARTPVGQDGTAEAELALPRPVVVSHRLEARLLARERLLAVRRLPFTNPPSFPGRDFTVLLWSYPRGGLAVRRANRACYEMGTDLMDLCHMMGYSDADAAREYAVASQSGLRIVPYITRVAGTAHPDHSLSPGLFNEAWIESQRRSMQIASRQAAPYAPPATTLGDENYLCRGDFEVEVSRGSTAAFRRWLRQRYGSIDALNAAWKTDHESLAAASSRPLLLEDIIARSARRPDAGFAPWFDFRDFMDTAFAHLHERLAGFVRREQPGARVGWDGLLGYHWLAGYDFDKLTRNLALNQVYTTHPLEVELVRSLHRPGALLGQWGNAVAAREDGFSAIAWHNLFHGYNSCWWWTLWGCDYIPFHPDLSVSDMGKWFFRQVREIKAGPGRLLLHAKRDDSGIAILYSQADFFAATLAARLCDAEGGAWPAGLGWKDDLLGAAHWIEDLGCQYRFVAAARIESDGEALEDFRVLFLPYATCISDRLAASVREFVRLGGLVIADGRTGILTANGEIRTRCALDDVLGVRGATGVEALARRPTAVDSNVPGVTAHDFGRGRAILLGAPFAAYNRWRNARKEGPALDVLRGLLSRVDLRPFARLRTADGRPRRIEQAMFIDSALRYLALEQDILQRGLAPLQAVLTLREPAFVYDMREHRALNDIPITSWPVKLSRGRPVLFALLPYKVAALRARAPATARPGEEVRVRVEVEAAPVPVGFHVVRADVFAPGAQEPHRQYSINIDCPAGRGTAVIPLALSDPPGRWRIELRDAASGAAASVELDVRFPDSHREKLLRAKDERESKGG